MDDQYKPIYKQAQSLQFTINDWIDDHASPMAGGIKQLIRSLQDDMEMNKSPRTVEERIKAIDRQLQQMGEGEVPVMSRHHADELQRKFEDLRRDLRGLSNY